METNQRIVFIIEDDNNDLHRIEVVAASTTEAWETLPLKIRQMTLVGVRSFSMKETNHAVG